MLSELLLPTSLVRTDVDRREKCVRYLDTLLFAVIQFSSAVIELQIPG
jgi:hypothetical protein